MTGAASPVLAPTSLTNLGAKFPCDLYPAGKRLAFAVAQDQPNVVRDKVVFVINFSIYLRKITRG